MSGYEIWIFTDTSKQPGRVVSVEDAPDTYGRIDAQHLANLRVLEHASDGYLVTALVREPGCY